MNHSEKLCSGRVKERRAFLAEGIAGEAAQTWGFSEHAWVSPMRQTQDGYSINSLMGYLCQDVMQEMGLSLCVLYGEGFNKANLVLSKLLDKLIEWLWGWFSPGMAWVIEKCLSLPLMPPLELSQMNKPKPSLLLCSISTTGAIRQKISFSCALTRKKENPQRSRNIALPSYPLAMPQVTIPNNWSKRSCKGLLGR